MAVLSPIFLGLESLTGSAGIGLGGGVAMFLGNPLSGLSTGPHWLLETWATIGQLLPPGAAGSLLRANAYFDGIGDLQPIVTLTARVVFGLVLVVIADQRWRSARRHAEHRS
ncbi:hypothetical protein [Actinomadura opuntiae]|uniref:hypothetical protein n=1 Tax=Actinomadura sp. OS1-43 TaxID=604315 RepID=UPI00255A7861|nr:hypothetical protein [Actinomadura sp. OS1-43]MDL4817178.1 hypothetical protein [Actinomadura sp. OS1-43]